VIAEVSKIVAGMRETMQRMEKCDATVAATYDAARDDHHAGCYLLDVHRQVHDPCDCRCHELPNTGAST
jgi:hypothetical protein